LGFLPIRQKGSHVFYRRGWPHHDGARHKGRDVAVPLVRAILADVRAAPDEFLRLIGSR
jgi:predicted RNA binding protein YcfA (HicA-like mRNA interferase family)